MGTADDENLPKALEALTRENTMVKNTLYHIRGMVIGTAGSVNANE